MSMRRAGFALLEVLVAVVIFAVIAAIAYRGLDTVSRTRTQLAAANARLRELSIAIHLIETDLGQVVARPVRSLESFARTVKRWFHC